MASFPHLTQPKASRILFSSNPAKSGAGTMDEQGAQVTISTFTDIVLNDKDYLPMILKKIVASARRDAGQDVTNELVVHSNPNAPHRRVQVNRVRALQAVYDVVADDLAVVRILPQRDTKQRRLPAQTQPELSGSRLDSGTRRGRKLELEDAEAKIAAVAPEATAAARAVGLDDADDNHLADLLNRLVLKVPSDKTKP
jgi:hypothetical protein